MDLMDQPDPTGTLEKDKVERGGGLRWKEPGKDWSGDPDQDPLGGSSEHRQLQKVTESTNRQTKQRKKRGP